MAYFLALLLNILWNYYSEYLELVGKEKCEHISLTVSMIYLNNPLWRFGSFKVVLFFFSPIRWLGKSGDTYDDWVILVDSEETEVEDWILLLLEPFTISPSAGSTAFLPFLFWCIVGHYFPESIQAKRITALKITYYVVLWF